MVHALLIYLIIIFMIQRIFYLLPNILLFKNNCNRVSTDKKQRKTTNNITLN